MDFCSFQTVLDRDPVKTISDYHLRKEKNNSQAHASLRENAVVLTLRFTVFLMKESN